MLTIAFESKPSFAIGAFAQHLGEMPVVGHDGLRVSQAGRTEIYWALLEKPARSKRPRPTKRKGQLEVYVSCYLQKAIVALLPACLPLCCAGKEPQVNL